MTFKLDEARLTARLGRCFQYYGCQKGESSMVACKATAENDRCYCTEYALLAVEVMKDELKQQAKAQAADTNAPTAA